MDKEDAFRLIDEETAGFLIGVLVAGLFIYDVVSRVAERFGG